MTRFFGKTLAQAIPPLAEEGWRDSRRLERRARSASPIRRSLNSGQTGRNVAELTTPSAPRIARRIHPSSARRGIFAAAVILLVLPAAASAHRLDEYLQATRFALATDHILVKIDLTPGVDVAPAIFALINTDRDGTISATEAKAYAKRLLDECVFELDGRPRRLEIISTFFPSFEDMQEGTGTIRIQARAPWRADPGHHVLFFRNNHKPDLGAYLVNALVPTSRAIEITDQRRDFVQREIRLDFNVQ